GGDGRPLTIGGVIYDKGLGVHPDSTVEVFLGGRCARLSASIGVDDEVGAAGSVTFEVATDGTPRYTSPTLTGTADPAPLDIDVTGAQILRLRVTDAGDGNAFDHADWAAATLSCTP